MIKKLISISLMFMLLFAFAACDDDNNSNNNVFNDELAEYKAIAKADIQIFAEELDEENYTAENWEIISGVITLSYAAIDAAEDIEGVDNAVTTTKDTIYKVATKEFDFNATIFSNVQRWMDEDFLKDNMTYGAYSVELEQYMDDPSLPRTRTIFVNDMIELQSIISSAMPVDFEKEMFIIYIYTGESPRTCFLNKILIEEEILKIYYKHEEYPVAVGDASMRMQRCLAVKMNKVDVTTVEFIKVRPTFG